MSIKAEDRHNEAGEEILDPVPMQPPLGYKKTMSLHEQIRQQVRLARMLDNESIAETEDEADDFEIGDDYEPLSKHENDHIPSIKVLKAKVKEFNDKIKEANRRAAVAAHEKAQSELTRKKQAPVVNPGADPSPEPGSA